MHNTTVNRNAEVNRFRENWPRREQKREFAGCKVDSQKRRTPRRLASGGVFVMAVLHFAKCSGELEGMPTQTVYAVTY